MVCDIIDTCPCKMTLDKFTDNCARIDDSRHCQLPDITHLKTPNGWRHYIRITHNTLSQSIREKEKEK